jgi:hypothetical protein
MALFLKIENGQPINHPAYDFNLVHAFGQIPEGWTMFNRVRQPNDLIIGTFQKANCTYGLSSDGVTWEDKWSVVDMTEEEKQNLIEEVQSNPPFPNAILDTTTLKWKGPPKPTDNQSYAFNVETGTWVVVQPKPDDGKKYYYDFSKNEWIEVFIPPSSNTA